MAKYILACNAHGVVLFILLLKKMAIIFPDIKPAECCWSYLTKRPSKQNTFFPDTHTNISGMHFCYNEYEVPVQLLLLPPHISSRKC